MRVVVPRSSQVGKCLTCVKVINCQQLWKMLHNNDGNRFERLRLDSVVKERDVSNTFPFEHCALQTLDRFYRMFYQKLQVIIFLCTLMLDFQSVATVKPLMNFVVLMNQILSLGGAVESESLNWSSRHIIPSRNEHFTTKSFQYVFWGYSWVAIKGNVLNPIF